MEETLIKRSMPNSLDAEQSVIGSMIMDKDAILTAMEMLTSDDFYHKQYGILFDAMIELYSKGLPVDLITLQNKLKEKEVPEEISSLSYVKELLDAVPTSANIKYYAKIVKDNSMRRRLIRLNEEIENECYAGKESIDTVMDMTEKKVFDLLSTRGGGGDYVPIRQVVMNALEKIENAAKTSGTVTGIPTGFIDLDYRTAGLQPSDLILIAARPSMGKTAFVLNIAQYVAFHEDMCTAIFSLEMSKEQLVNRLFSLESRVDAQTLRTGNLSDSDWEKLIEGAGTIGNSKLIIDDTPGISISELRSKCRKVKLEYGLSLVIIDYLQLMSGSGKSGENRQQCRFANITFITRTRRNNHGTFHTNENPQGDQHGVFHLFPNGYAKCKSGEVELEGIQFEHHHRQHNKQTQRQQFCQCCHQVNAGSGLHPAQDQKVNNPQ